METQYDPEVDGEEEQSILENHFDITPKQLGTSLAIITLSAIAAMGLHNNSPQLTAKTSPVLEYRSKTTINSERPSIDRASRRIQSGQSSTISDFYKPKTIQETYSDCIDTNVIIENGLERRCCFKDTDNGIAFFETVPYTNPTPNISADSTTTLDSQSK